MQRSYERWEKISDELSEKITKVRQRLNRMLHKMEEDIKKCDEVTAIISEKYDEIIDHRQDLAKCKNFVKNDEHVIRLLHDELRRLEGLRDST